MHNQSEFLWLISFDGWLKDASENGKENIYNIIIIYSDFVYTFIW